MEIITNLKGKVIVSVQAMPSEPLYREECLSAIMESVVNGGAAGLRVAGARDVINAKKFNVPVIGITKPKELPKNWREVVYITPTLNDVEELINAGADIIAFDGTLRDGKDRIKNIISRIHRAKKLAMADISTLREGTECELLDADIISTTLSGYTIESGEPTEKPDFELLKKLVSSVKKPVILEGRIWSPDDVKKAFSLGAHSVVIGSAITRPQLITKRFVEASL